ncbi:S8/S53 family peptidase [Rurimicrobium arvi]|uniref:Por secretion system C-terminal sorting domain-containing protein n=1 Tax=Rurimicrobium arvi TaxID=2049916 RepID=A0ABP8MI09_9BACT
MKQLYALLLATGLSWSAIAQEGPGLSPLTRMYLKDAQKMAQNESLPKGYLYKKRVDGRVCVSAIIKIKEGKAAEVSTALSGISASVGTRAGNIWTVQVPVTQVKAFTLIKEIAYIQLDEPVIPNLDVARATTRVDSVHQGIGLPQGYSGKGVIVGIMDFGFDYNHPTMYDTSGKRYRIVKAWEMNASGTPPSGFTYGAEISDTTLLKARKTDNNVQTHGSGVAGLAAGSGFGTAGRFKGMAYESDMILVGVRRDSLSGEWLTGGFSDFIDGVNYMMQYATSVGKPIVVNISWGSHSGPHDGSSLVNQAFDAMTGTGKLIVMSAGNDGGTPIHLQKTFTSSDTAIRTFLQFSTTPVKRTWIDIWGDTSKTFCVKTSLYTAGGTEGNSTGVICIDNTTKSHMLIAKNGLDTCYVETITSASEYNMKPRVTINIYNKSNDSVGIQVSGTSGAIDMWNEYYYYGYTYRYNCIFSDMGVAGATNGDRDFTISDMGAGKSVLLVGAYISKNKFTNLNGSLLGYSGVVGQLASFSSHGPYVDGRIKPDITAPGLTIATACNSQDADYLPGGASSNLLVAKYTAPSSGDSFFYSEFSGTSAASPIAAGITALLLQIDPTLTPARLAALIGETAIQDFYTGTLPASGTTTWGKGKINAYGAARKLLKELSIATPRGAEAPDVVLMPNPNTGSFNLDLQAPDAASYVVTVADISGKVVLHQDWKANAGHNILPLNLNQVAKGMYFVTVGNEKGSLSIKTQIQ